MALPFFNDIYNLHLPTSNIAHIYGIIWSISNPSIEMIKCIRGNQNSMLGFTTKIFINEKIIYNEYCEHSC